MRKTSILALMLALYVAMAVFMAGIVRAYFIYDEDYQYGKQYPTTAYSYISGDFQSMKLYSPSFRSEASGSTPGMLMMEYKWNIWPPGSAWQHYIAFDDDGNDFIMKQDQYPGQLLVADTETRAGYYDGGYHWDTDWAIAAIPLNP
jgi:hypothetical protein